MATVFLVGLGSGLVSALLFATLISGSALSILLFYVAPLPIFIASLGWPHRSGLIATAAGGLALGVTFGPTLGLVFAVGIGLPAWWLSYLALLARTDAAGTTDWYSVGRLVLWGAAIGAALTVLSFPIFTGDVSDYRPAFRAALEAVLRAQLDTPEGDAITLPNGADVGRFLDLMVVLLPPMAALSTMLAILFNLWLGARIVRRSKRLPRPWPDIAASFTLPRGTAVLLGLLLLATLLPGLPGLVAELGSVTLVASFMLLGFAVLHVITRGLQARPFILGAAYLLVLLQAWLVLVALVGLVEQLAGIRARVAARRTGSLPPPANRT